MKVKKEFADLLEPLTSEEYEQLKQNLMADGCREPLVVWGEYIVDGHNRFKICSSHGIAYKTVQKKFFDDNEAMDWIDKNQLGRRNLSPLAFTKSLGRRMERTKKKVGAPKGNTHNKQSGVTQSQIYQNDIIDSPLSADQKIAEEHGVGEATVRRAARFVRALDTLKDFAPEIDERIKERKQVVKKDVIKAAELLRNGDEDGAREVLDSSKPSNKGAIRVTTDQLGNDLPDSLVGVFNDKSIKRWLKTLTELNKEVKSCKSSVVSYIREDTFAAGIKQVRGLLNGAVPYMVCQDCGGEGCDECHDFGFLTEVIYTNRKEE